MSNNSNNKDLVKRSAQSQQVAKASTLSVVKSLVNTEGIVERFVNAVKGDKNKAMQFLGSITSLVSGSTNFNDVDGNTIVASALVAATLDLPINPSIGFAYIVPYNCKVKTPDGDTWIKKAQFQMSYRSYIQLAMRSGQYSMLNADAVYEGEISSRNRLTGEIKFDGERASEKTVGYFAHFELLNGFKKTLYMTIDELQAHGKKFSKSYADANGLWKKDFHNMALKTVTKLLLSKYGLLSVDMQRAVEADQSIVDNDGKPTEYPDGTNGEVPAQFEEVKELSPEEWEMPIKVLAKIETFTDFNELNEWTNKNADRLTSFVGKDGESIDSAIKAKIKELTK